MSEREDRILDTLPMQRLARVKQLGHTYIVYPSAVHTRLEHSLGAMYIAGRICDSLEIKDEQKEAVRATALLHDAGHGPFSHVFEKVMRFVNGDGFSHEDVTRILIERDESLRHVLGSLSQDMLNIMSSHDTLTSDIVSGSVDADKLDYLRRDSYHTGVFYGVFDLERIVRAICKIPENDRDYLGIDEKGKDALENYRLARYSMHSQVYEHHTRLIADDMFTRGIISSIKEGTLPRETFDVSDARFVENHLKFDDASIEHFVIQNCGPVGKDLIERIRRRKLLKRAFHVPLTKEAVPNAIRRRQLEKMSPEDIDKREKKISEESGVPIEHLIIHLQSMKIKLYERFDAVGEEAEDDVLIRRKNRPPAHFYEESPIFAAANPIRNLFVFCPEEHVPKVKEICESTFDAKSFH